MAEPIEAFGGRTWEELDVLEHEQGQLMFPAKVRRRDPKGQVVETAVRVRVPSPNDTFAARAEVKEWATELKLDRKEDEDYFRQAEQLCLLSRAIRTYEEPYGQFATKAELGAYDETCLHDIQEQIAAFKEQLDPRDSVRTDEEFWKSCASVAKEMNIRPLGDMAGRDQQPFVVRMALEACRSPRGLSALRSFGISIPEHLLSTSSAPS